VVGDVMLDHFIVGQVDRISPEAPVPVVRFEREDFRLGGAANVAQNVSTLGGRASLIGVVGTDPHAAELSRQLGQAGLGAERLVADASRPTTRKVRVVTSRNQQVARVDHEADRDIDDTVLAAVVRHVTEAAASADALVLSDYRKGVVTTGTIAAAVAAGRQHRIPVLVDPKVARADRYRGTSLVTPNHHEAELMTQLAIRTTEDAGRAARSLHERTGANVLITWGEQGMFLLDAMSSPAVEAALPAVAREVADVTGAGDTVIAVLALALAAGASLVDAAHLANAAAGLVVARFGPVGVTPDELAAAVG
jgi:D-beta-D-heptose 7-phosphate kinase/D-beta-D-heptose 1-phosphate adenosyltransferase